MRSSWLVLLASACIDLPVLDGSPGPTGDTASEPGLATIVALAAGEQHSLLLADDGTVWGTGNNSAGQLGLPEATGGVESFTELGVTDVVGIEAGSITSFLLLDDGGVTASGHNGAGALGIDDPGVTYQHGFVALAEMGLDQVRSGGGHTLARTGEDTLVAFGANHSGELGIGTTSSAVHAPAGVPGLKDVLDFDAAAGGGFSVAVIEGGAVYTWGNNFGGALGDAGAGPNAVDPLVLSTAPSTIAVAAGGSHTLALTAEGTVWAWGANQAGQLGRGTLSDTETPALVKGLDSIVAIDAGSTFSIALDDQGAVWVWGSHGQGQLGLGYAFGATATTPQQVPGLPPITAVMAGSSHVLGLSDAGTVFGWGLMDAAQLGTGVGEWQFEPVRIF